jgi:hypothetical protein
MVAKQDGTGQPKKLHRSKKGCCSLCAQNYELKSYFQLPEWLRHNPSIVSGYRVDLSLADAFRSLFHVHNGSPLLGHPSKILRVQNR